MDTENKKERFEKMALPHMSALYTTALYLTGKKEDAEDLVQETVLKAYRFFDTFSQGSNFRAWIMTILKNNFVNRYRQVKRQNVISEGDVEEFVLYQAVKESEGDNPETELLQKFENEEIQRAIAELPLDYREAILLCDVQELSYDEISRVLNCPVGTVRSRIHRGRQILQKKLYELGREKGYFKKGKKENEL